MQPIHPILTPEQVLDRCNSLLEELEDLLLGIEPMSGDEIRRLPAVPSDADELVAEVTSACATLGASQIGDGATLANVAKDMDVARQLRDLGERHDRVRAQLASWRVSGAARGWRTTLAFYAMLKRLARANGALGEALKPAREYFKRRRSPFAGEARRRATLVACAPRCPAATTPAS